MKTRIKALFFFSLTASSLSLIATTTTSLGFSSGGYREQSVFGQLYRFCYHITPVYRQQSRPSEQETCDV